MRYTILLLLIPFLVKSQGTIVDASGNIVGITKLSDSVKYFASKNRADSLLNAVNGKQPVGSYLVAADITGKLNTSDSANMLLGYSRSSHVHTFSSLTSKPTTLSGYGITDGAGNGNGAITNAMLAGSIDLTTKVTGILPFSSNAGSSAATSATTGTMTVNMTTTIITITPSGACTFNASGGVTGQRLTFVITTSGTTSFTLTFGTNFKSTATLATGTTTAKIFAVSFLCTNGTQWIETSRTAAQ